MNEVNIVSGTSGIELHVLMQAVEHMQSQWKPEYFDYVGHFLTEI